MVLRQVSGCSEEFPAHGEPSNHPLSSILDPRPFFSIIPAEGLESRESQKPETRNQLGLNPHVIFRIPLWPFDARDAAPVAGHPKFSQAAEHAERNS